MFDALMTRAVAAELTEKLTGGRVQAVLSLSDLSLGLEVYAHRLRSYVLASADATTNSVHLVSQKLRSSGEPPSPFILLLKKHAEGAFINRVEAVPRERILRIEFDHSELGISILVAELMGRLSNLIMIDGGGVILDAIKRISPGMSRLRSIQPKSEYLAPPAQDKADPLDLSPELLARALERAAGEPLWQVLVKAVAATSPLLGRELAFRVGGRADVEADPKFAKALTAEFSQVWGALPEPTLAFAGDEPVAIAPFPLMHLERTEKFNSMSEALEKFYGSVAPYQPPKEPLRKSIEASRARVERKCNSLRRQIITQAEMERLRTSGELVLAYASNIKKGQKTLTAEMTSGMPLQIKLDPDRTPIENAQSYFSQYRRAKDAAAAVPGRLEEAEADLAYADQILADLEEAENREEIDAVVAEARAAKLIPAGDGNRGRRGRTAHIPAASVPRDYVSPDGFRILVGRNARQNDLVTFRMASSQDMWLHARNAAGAHVVIVTGGRQVPASTVDYAASLAAFHSQAREQLWVDVAVASRANVRRVAGRAARPGLVTVQGERLVRARPREGDRSDRDQEGE